MTRVLVLSPHPDDEAIGCGGVIAKHAADGARVRVVFLTSGEQGGHGRSPEDTAVVREAEAREAARVLGIEQVEFWRERDGALRATEALVDRLRRELRAHPTDVVYSPHPTEMHPDHQATARLVRRALSSTARAARRPRVLLYEVWTPVQRIDEIVDITPHVDVKRQAIRAHESQCAVLAFDDAILGLNRYRGEMFSWPEGEYAECFMEMRT